MKRHSTSTDRTAGAWLTALFVAGVFILVAVVLGAGIYKQGYDTGQFNTQALTAKPTPRLVFDCNIYHNPYFGCVDAHENMTGLYCNGKLACERKWEDP